MTHDISHPLRSRARLLVVSCLASAIAVCFGVSSASGADTVSLSANFSPDRGSESTTIGFTVAMKERPGEEGPALTGMNLHLPAGMQYDESQLGIAACDRDRLERLGLSVCPQGSRMGYGHGVVLFEFAGEQHEAKANIAIVLGTALGEGTPLLLYVETQTPVVAGLVFEGRLLNDAGRFGQRMSIELPLTAPLPGGPPVRIASMSVNFGPKELTYFRQIHGRNTAFKPRGLSVPPQCPPGGYPMLAVMSFADGTQASTSSKVACAPASRRRPSR